MPIKNRGDLAQDIARMGWKNVRKNQVLLNTCSKALAKQWRKDTFNYLNDKNREPNYLFVKYIRPNDVNVSNDLKAEATKNFEKKDSAKLALTIKKIDTEVEILFMTNLRESLLLSDAYMKHYYHLHNMPEYKKLGDAIANKCGISLKVKSVKELSAAIVTRLTGDKPKYAGLIAAIEKKDKVKDLNQAIETGLKAAGVAA